MKSLLTADEAKSLFAELNNVSDLEAALLRASIFVRSKVKKIDEQVPDDIKLAVCYLIKAEKNPQKKSIERSDYKETFSDSNKSHYDMALELLSSYVEEDKGESGVFFF